MLDVILMNNLEILYEDNHIIVVVKPCNILSQEDSTKDPDMLTIIKEYIKVKYNKPGNVYLGLVHRLDRPVSGIMVFAKTSKAASRLSNEMKENNFSKKYLAVVHDNLLKSNDTFIDYILKSDNGNSIVTNEKNGKYSELSYNVVDKQNKLALVNIELLTGRHHQIRIQFASRNCPLYGDWRYGKKDSNKLYLHAYELTFKHPITKEYMTFNKYPDLDNNIWSLFNLRKMTN